MEHTGPERPLINARASGVEQHVSTGSLPPRERIAEVLEEAFAFAMESSDGSVADYIPELARADPELLGVCLANVRGDTLPAGDADVEFSIQSISKAFVYALACEELGHDAVFDRVGVNNTGLAFDSIVAIEMNAGHPRNPMVNAGAMTTTALVPGSSADERWDAIRTGLSEFAGHPLEVDDAVYRSESATNQRNRAIARLLESYDRIESDPLEVVDVYTKQCSLGVTARDLAVMGATLADGGVNPVTGRRVVSAQVCQDTLAVLAASGLYERSGEWLFEVGLPGKSGVSGGIVTVSPGKGALGVFSPRLDPAGNSVRGQRATAYLSKALGLNIFASDPHPDVTPG